MHSQPLLIMLCEVLITRWTCTVYGVKVSNEGKGIKTGAWEHLDKSKRHIKKKMSLMLLCMCEEKM